MTAAAKALILIAAVTVLIATCVVGIKVTTAYVEGVRTEAFAAGEAKKDAEYKGRDNEALAAAHKKIVDLLLANQGLERKLAAANRTIESQLLREKEDAEKVTETLLVRLDDDDLRLRDGVIEVAACTGVDRAGGAAQAGGSARGAPAAACAKFSAASRRALVGILAEGDDAIRERNACVAIALNDRLILSALTAGPPGSSVGPARPVQQP